MEILKNNIHYLICEFFAISKSFECFIKLVSDRFTIPNLAASSHSGSKSIAIRGTFESAPISDYLLRNGHYFYGTIKSV